MTEITEKCPDCGLPIHVDYFVDEERGLLYGEVCTGPTKGAKCRYRRPFSLEELKELPGEDVIGGPRYAYEVGEWLDNGGPAQAMYEEERSGEMPEEEKWENVQRIFVRCLRDDLKRNRECERNPDMGCDGFWAALAAEAEELIELHQCAVHRRYIRELERIGAEYFLEEYRRQHDPEQSWQEMFYWRMGQDIDELVERHKKEIECCERRAERSRETAQRGWEDFAATKS